jgi:chitodextrinase
LAIALQTLHRVVKPTTHFTHALEVSPVKRIGHALALANLVLVSLLLPSFEAAAQSATIGSAAAQLGPGEWTEITTSNISSVLGASGSSRMVFGYTDDGVWDPVSRQFFFIGGDHGDAPRFVAYSESSNAWRVMPTPPWFPNCSNGCTPMHGYDHSAINPQTGDLYHRPFNSRNVHKYTRSSATWSTLPAPSTGDYNACCVGVEYFPELGGLVIVNGAGGSGSVYLFDEGSQQWSTLARGLSMGTYHNFAEYDRVHKVLLFGGGNSSGTRKIYKLDSARQVTALRDAPVNLGIQQALHTVDPVSGTFLIFTSGRTFYTYNVVTDTWQLQSAPAPIYTTAYSTNGIHGVIASPVSTHGVVMFVTCNSSSCRVRLYRHAAGGVPAPNPPPSDTAAPTVSLTTLTSGAIVSGTVALAASASDNVGIAGVQFKVDGVNVGDEDSSAPYSASWDTASVANGSHTVAVVARDAAGNTRTSAATSVTVNNNVSSPPPPAGSTDFAAKCQAAGVLACFGFDSQTELFYTWPTGGPCDSVFAGKTNNGFGRDRRGRGNTVATVQNGRCVYPDLDTSIRRSGAGALKFTIPSNSGENTSGYFTELFKRNADGSFGYIAPGSPLGNVVYFQFYQRFDPNFLNTRFQCVGGSCGGWKQVIFFGDPPNGASASMIEVTLNNGWQRGLTHMYGQIGMDDYGVQDAAGCAWFSGRTSYPEPPCVRFKANQWMQYTGRIEVRGASNERSSRVQLWIDGKLVIDNSQARVAWGGGDGRGFGQFMLTPFHTAKDRTQVHPEGHTWYDDVIISTQPIAMSSGTQPPPAGDTTAPTIPAGVTATAVSASQVNLAWTAATDNTGVASYRVFRNGSQVGTTTGTTYQDTGLTASTVYTYRVVAIDSAGKLSEQSTAVSATTAPPVVSTFTLTVTRSGPGQGTVSSSPTGITCGTDCTQNYPAGTRVTLTANAATGSVFAGWTGAPDCADGVVTLSSALSCTVTFNLQRQTLTVTKAGTGAGTVTATPTGIACGTDCTETYGGGSRVTLTATPTTGSAFTGWSGDADCSDGVVTLSASMTCIATFRDTAPPTVTLTTPVSGATVRGSAIALGASASDGSGAVSVQFKVDGTPVGEADGSAPYTATWNASSTGPGPHTLEAVARDAAGNEATARISVVLARGSVRNVGPTDPWCAIVNSAAAGDEIVFAPGTYTATCWLTAKGQAGAPIVMRSGQDASGTRATFQYSGNTANVLELRDTTHLVIRGFRFAATRSYVDAIRVWRATDAAVEDNIFEGIGGTSIRVTNLSSARLSVVRNLFTGLRHAAMKFGCEDGVACRVTEVLVEDNVVTAVVPGSSGEMAYAVEVRPNSQGTIRGNTVSRTSGPGIVVYGAGGGSTTVVEKNVVEQSLSAAGIVVAGSGVVVRNNIVVGNAGGGIRSTAGPKQNVWIVHNTVANNGQAGINVDGWDASGSAGNVLAYNAVLPSSGGSAVRPGTPVGTVLGNVTCSSSSACFGTGVEPVASGPLVDAAGSGSEPWRPLDDFADTQRTGAADVGAIELEP